MKTKKGKQKLKCGICGQTGFSRTQALRGHERGKHGGGFGGRVENGKQVILSLLGEEMLAIRATVYQIVQEKNPELLHRFERVKLALSEMGDDGPHAIL